MSSHARTRSASYTYTHLGAHAAPRTERKLPRRLSPRRTMRLAGVRVTPRQHEGIVAGLGISAFIVTICDFDSDPTRWMPLLFQIFGF